MAGLVSVGAAAVVFLGSHFALSHPLRAPFVKRLGEGAFAGVYSVIAGVCLIWVALAYRSAPRDAPLWSVGPGLWAAVTLVMLLASILLLGSLVGNPALPSGGRAAPAPVQARGVFSVTRHPMMWAVALWGLCHIAVYPVARNIIVASTMVVLALVGAALQDRKKERLEPEIWTGWEAKTSYWPFAAIAAGRARLRGFRPHDLAGGVIFWLAATWAHLPLAGWAAGIWRWLPH